MTMGVSKSNYLSCVFEIPTLKRLTFNIRAQWLEFYWEAVIAFLSLWSSVFPPPPQERVGCLWRCTTNPYTSRSTISEGENCMSKKDRGTGFLIDGKMLITACLQHVCSMCYHRESEPSWDLCPKNQWQKQSSTIGLSPLIKETQYGL